MTQADVARGLNLSAALICKLKKQGMPVHSIEAAAAWRQRHVGAYARAGAPPPPAPPPPPATGPAEAIPGTPLDLAQERAMLAREQRVQLEIKTAVLRGEYASITLLSEVLATASQAVAERLDQLPALLRRTSPDMPMAAVDTIMATIAAARNEWVRQTVALATIIMGIDDDDEPEDADPAGEATAP